MPEVEAAVHIAVIPGKLRLLAALVVEELALLVEEHQLLIQPQVLPTQGAVVVEELTQEMVARAAPAS
jgi:hypothetical protein